MLLYIYALLWARLGSIAVYRIVSKVVAIVSSILCNVKFVLPGEISSAHVLIEIAWTDFNWLLHYSPEIANESVLIQYTTGITTIIARYYMLSHKCCFFFNKVKPEIIFVVFAALYWAIITISTMGKATPLFLRILWLLLCIFSHWSPHQLSANVTDFTRLPWHCSVMSFAHAADAGFFDVFALHLLTGYGDIVPVSGISHFTALNRLYGAESWNITWHCLWHISCLKFDSCLISWITWDVCIKPEFSFSTELRTSTKCIILVV